MAGVAGPCSSHAADSLNVAEHPGLSIGLKKIIRMVDEASARWDQLQQRLSRLEVAIASVTRARQAAASRQVQQKGRVERVSATTLSGGAASLDSVRGAPPGGIMIHSGGGQQGGQCPNTVSEDACRTVRKSYI